MLIMMLEHSRRFLRKAGLSFSTTETVMGSFLGKIFGTERVETGYLGKLFNFHPVKIGSPIYINGGKFELFILFIRFQQ